MKFKDYFLCENEKSPTFCYMIYAESPYTGFLENIQKNSNIVANEFVKPEQFHCTVRFCKLNSGQNSFKFLEWLTEQELPEITAFTSKFSMFNDGAIVLELESPELHEWFEKVNARMNHFGYMPSDFPTFKPHISIAYDSTSPLPNFDVRNHHIKIKLTKHIVTNQLKEVVFDRQCTTAKAIPSQGELSCGTMQK
jgi:2'-5' RNA ligase